MSGDQTGQNYDALVFGDVASSFVHRASFSSHDATDGSSELAATVAAVSLPQLLADPARTNFTVPVTTSTIEAKNDLVGFQGDFTFDERMIKFQSDPVQKAGVTEGNWNVSGNVLPGAGPIRTLRISGYSTDFRPLSGEGTLFELRISAVVPGNKTTLFNWAAPNPFTFIDANLNVQKPAFAAPGGAGF